jgi:DDE superfamily endonuclease
MNQLILKITQTGSIERLLGPDRWGSEALSTGSKGGYPPQNRDLAAEHIAHSSGILRLLAFKAGCKPKLGLAMLDRALEAGVPFAWVSGDCVYGADHRIRRRLEARQRGYVLAVTAK